MRKSLIVLLPLLCAAESPASLQIMQPTEFHAEEVKAKDGDVWWAFVVTGDTGVLRETRLKITRFEDIMDKPGQKTGKRVSVSGPKPVLLLHGNASFLAERSVAVARAGEKLPASIDRNHPIRLRLGSQRYTLVMDENNSMETGVVLRGQGGVRQLLYEQNETGDLLWAGDLDDDGKLDLLIDGTINHYNEHYLMLFLSSAAKGKNLVGRAAFLISTGC